MSKSNIVSEINQTAESIKISAERIQVELTKLLISPHPDTLRDAYDMGVTKVILPEFDAMMETTQETLHHCYNVGEHTIHALMNIPADKVLRLTMLFHDTGKPARKTVDPDGTAHFKGHAYVSEELTRSIMHRLKFDNDTLRKVSKLVLYHDDRMPATMKHVRRAMNRISEELFPYYMKVRMADTLAQSDYQRDKKLENLAGIEKCYQEILEKKQCVSLKELKVNGQDLDQAVVAPGEKVSVTFDTLFNPVTRMRLYNTDAAAIYNEISGLEGKKAGNLRGSYGYYFFGSTGYKQTVENFVEEGTDASGYNNSVVSVKDALIVPEDYSAEKFVLSQGTFNVAGFGGDYGAHRAMVKTWENLSPNTSAYMGQLPDISIPVGTLQSIEVTAQPITAEAQESSMTW